MKTIEQYRTIYEVITFLFEEYKEEYKQLIRDQYSFNLSDKKIIIELKTFTSWCAIETLNNLKKNIK